MALQITWLGHSTVLLDLDGTRLLTDPLLRRHAGVLRRRGPAPADRHWRAVDGVLLSHLHHDHAHLSSLRRLQQVPVVTGPANARWLHRRGLPGAVGLAEDTWLPVGTHGVRVRLTRAEHGHRPMPHRPNDAHGHLVRGSVSVWVLGDTAPYPQMAGIPRLAGAPSGIDLAVVPISGWGPRLSGGHLGPREAAAVCATVRARAAVPVHWGTLHVPGGSRVPPGWMDRPVREFAAALAELAPDCEPVTLAPGQSWRH